MAFCDPRLPLRGYRLLNLPSGRISGMQFNGLIVSSTDPHAQPISRISAGRSWSLLLMAVTLAIASSAQTKPINPVGLAWQVKGLWHVEGQTEPVQTGAAILPGALLHPVSKSPAHSITILLPDGQRILYECFLDSDCARGFRVPLLYRKPDPLAVDMLARIRAALVKERQEPITKPVRQMALPRDEAVVILDAHNHGEVTGLVSALPNGLYTYTLRSIGRADAQPIRKTFEKTKASIDLEMPSTGLFNIEIADRLNTPRVDLVVAAVAPDHAAVKSSFHDAQALLGGWNTEFQGWPIHDFQRAYLASLLLHIDPSIQPTLTSASIEQKNRAGMVQEPAFTPRPGVFHSDTSVTLRCGTPGAAIHFTVDGSQPLISSPVYNAPIMVKGTALTIKAFATMNDKDQSNVVTGIFIIGN
jgi:hypothetical protein